MKKIINNELTIIIKTFERYKCLKKMLESIYKEGLREFRIIILDDSKVSYRNNILKEFSEKLDINYISSEFNIGLSSGRNKLLNEVKTPYFLLCDDDYIFDNRVNLKENLEKIKKLKLDILGGSYYNRYTINNFYEIIKALKSPRLMLNIILKKEIISSYTGIFEIIDNKLYLIKDKIRNEKIYSTDIVNNFFIGKTSAIIKIGGWNEKLKIAEHEEFFYRVKLNNLKVAFSKELGILHFPIRSYKYNKYRTQKINYYTELWLKEYGLESMETVYK